MFFSSYLTSVSGNILDFKVVRNKVVVSDADKKNHFDRILGSEWNDDHGKFKPHIQRNQQICCVDSLLLYQTTIGTL